MTVLSAYKKKRKLAESPEPKARALKKKHASLIFVVQKHHASHLHYDLRLELDGVLKSWAVPKGPPKSPDDKRLAIMVEDHPYEYKDFHGVIPEGHYGAGTVEIYDKGSYEIPDAESLKEQEKLMRAGLKKGHVSFLLKGKKLKGEYALVRTKLPGGKDQWLWLKKGESKKSVQKKTKEKMPTEIKPMLAQLWDKPFDKENWLFEVKWDGYRCIAIIKAKTVKLLSRNEKSFNKQFPSIVSDLKTHLKHDAILDGELVVLDSSGRSQFQLIQNYQQEEKGYLCYYVFDLLYLDGRDLREQPLIFRKELLQQIIAPLKKTHIRYSDHVEEKGKALFKEAKKLDLEGIMAKDSLSTYQMRRSQSWLKIKTHLRQEAVIGGFTAPRKSREKFGALLLGVYEGKNLYYVGHVGTGFDNKTLIMLNELLEPLISDRCPFEAKPKTNMPATFVKPRLICEISFAEWTKDGLMRQPVFLGLRTDKKPHQVVKEI